MTIVIRTDTLLVLESEGTSLVLDARGGGVPKVAHWGDPLGAASAGELARALDAAALPTTPASTDEPLALGIIPEATRGWQGIPGVEGARGDRGESTSFVFRGWSSDTSSGGDLVRIALGDPLLDLALDIEVEMRAGLIRMRSTLRNTGVDAYRPAAVRLTLPIPLEAGELLDLSGHALAERRPQRRPLVQETVMRENRRGRTGHDSVVLLAAGRPGFGFGDGEVWAVHLGWSGDAQVFAQRMNNGVGLLGAGELLRPGEVELPPGEELESPDVYFAHGHGLDAVSARFHDHLRTRHRAAERPRPVTLNVWEAVYFDHSFDRIAALADSAAEVGVERFVLDDGWFGARRDDTRGLGDWQVSPEVWPHGLKPLAHHVHALGMQFGLWFEPEMINPDSELARAHPDWILGAAGREPMLTRNQSVLNIAHPDAWEHILGELDARVREVGVDYIKWDHNRDLIDAVDAATGRPVVRAQTRATYRMIDELRRRHPKLEIESCSGGGGRVDLGILARTERVWNSDCIDALDRQHIQRWTSLLVPLWMQGTHVGSPVAHTTGRRHSLSFRAITALFGHFGIEWDISRATDDERAELARWVARYKEWRGLLHGGRYHRVDSADEALLTTGVVASDRGEALFSICLLDSSANAPLGRVRLPGLDPDVRYRVRAVEAAAALSPSRQPGWLAAGATSTGAALARLGLAVPSMFPEQALLLHLVKENA